MAKSSFWKSFPNRSSTSVFCVKPLPQPHLPVALQPLRQLRVDRRPLAVERDTLLLLLLLLLPRLLLAVVLVQRGVRDRLRALVQLIIHEVAVHVRLQRLAAHQVLQTQLRQLASRHLPSSVSSAPTNL